MTVITVPYSTTQSRPTMTEMDLAIYVTIVHWMPPRQARADVAVASLMWTRILMAFSIAMMSAHSIPPRPRKGFVEIHYATGSRRAPTAPKIVEIAISPGGTAAVMGLVHCTLRVAAHALWIAVIANPITPVEKQFTSTGGTSPIIYSLPAFRSLC